MESPTYVYVENVVRAIDEYIEAKVSTITKALIERGHTDECYSGEMEECDCPLNVLNEL